METYKASGPRGRMRGAAFGEVYSTHLGKADLVPADAESFEAELRVGALGPAHVVRLASTKLAIDRTPRHIAHASSRVFSFLLQTRGSSVLAHYGHEALLREGDITLFDSAAPYSWLLEDGSEAVMLRVPAHVLEEHVPSPEYFCGRHLPAHEGLTKTVGAVTLSLCAQIESGLSFEFQNRVARHLLDLIGTAYAMAFDAVISTSSIIGGRHAKVKLYIEQHLRDPELSPCAIANRLKLSSRYLRMIFATGSETVSAYILRRRLEECARQMSDPRWQGHSISEIAFAWGFNSAPHFTRSFRERFGVSPRHYRRVQLERRSQNAPMWNEPRAGRPGLRVAAA